MFRFHALCGMSVVTMQAALVASAGVARAQGSEQVLPPVTVEAPKPKAKQRVQTPDAHCRIEAACAAAGRDAGPAAVCCRGQS